jgi:Rrf2 family protein
MLTFSKKIDYSLLALSYLTRTSERPVNTKEIAEEYDIPVELLAKILQKLAKADILISTPGPTGGYRLHKNPDEITIGFIVDTIEGRPALVQCLRTDHATCEQHDKCTIRTPLMRVNERVLRVLDHLSLAEICKDENSTVHSIPLLVRG